MIRNVLFSVAGVRSCLVYISLKVTTVFIFSSRVATQGYILVIVRNGLGSNESSSCASVIAGEKCRFWTHTESVA